MYLGFFLRLMYRMGIFFGCKNLKYYFGVHDFPDIFDAVSNPAYEEKIRDPPPPGIVFHSALVVGHQ